MLLTGRFGNVKQKLADFFLTYTVSVDNVDIHADLLTAGWNGITPRNFIITVNPGVQLGSVSVATPGVTIPNSFPNNSVLNLFVQGEISGRGGAGGAGGTPTGGPGGDGGTALEVDPALTVALLITNTGEINGGGGGGGGGGRSRGKNDTGEKFFGCSACCTANGGNGGSGYGNGSQTSGSGGASCGNCDLRTGGSGGNGGGKGVNGNNGNNGINASGCVGAGGGGLGGTAGPAVDGNSAVTWLSVGTINGVLIN